MRKLRVELLVRLGGVYAECKPAAAKRLDLPVLPDEPWHRMSGARAGEPAARVQGEIRHRDELAGRDLAGDDLVRVGEEIGRLGMLARQRAEDELRHRHVGRRIDAVAGDVTEHDRDPAVAELEEVVDVAADVEARSGLVHGTDVEPRKLRPLAGQERALDRLRERFLLLVETRVVECERGLRRNRGSGSDRLRRDRRRGIERQNGELCEQLALGRERNDDRGRALGEERRRQSVRTS